MLQGNEQVVLVVKKNKSVLERLLGWIGGAAPASLPVLVIDDEADQASINTGGNRPPLDEVTDLTADDLGSGPPEQELDPSVINGLVRQLLGRFRRVSYVAYTATPFANILIDDQAVDRVAGSDLYPSDFILSLPRPSGYVGAERLFGRGALPGEDDVVPGLDVFRRVSDDEAAQHTPGSAGVFTYQPQITPAMREAFLDFVLATAAREYRAGVAVASTMLIHTHHRTPVQLQLGGVVREHVTQLRQSWRYDRASLETELRTRWESGFRGVTRSIRADTDVTFEAIVPNLDVLFRDPFSVIVLNSGSDDELDYERDRTIKAIVVGGNRLSRGLTLEGLTVSYYLRSADAYDTLMQMGRWFGYREDYVDLTRIYTTAQLYSWFRDLALAESELRVEMARYQRERLTPRDLGMRIRSHPIMLVTARNKMGSGEVIRQSYSARLLQTTYFQVRDRGWLEHNTAAVQRLIAALGQPNGGARELRTRHGARPGETFRRRVCSRSWRTTEPIREPPRWIHRRSGGTSSNNLRKVSSRAGGFPFEGDGTATIGSAARIDGRQAGCRSIASIALHCGSPRDASARLSILPSGAVHPARPTKRSGSAQPRSTWPNALMKSMERPCARRGIPPRACS